MLSKKIEAALNGQVAVEANSSQAYLAMASWAENQGLSGTAAFLYRHSDEERLVAVERYFAILMAELRSNPRALRRGAFLKLRLGVLGAVSSLVLWLVVMAL